ncbi:hypothetical protein PIB30_054268 [Stylosanthes scabra]|uniref:Uncharacterized protein n=1 Tax=Stylosanthes scabra TaxID=79078 RepID=A0ABU6TKC0_9FABA|nr:hypothetical protein [Stylosanthes scabra]
MGRASSSPHMAPVMTTLLASPSFAVDLNRDYRVGCDLINFFKKIIKVTIITKVMRTRPDRPVQPQKSETASVKARKFDKKIRKSVKPAKIEITKKTEEEENREEETPLDKYRPHLGDNHEDTARESSSHGTTKFMFGPCCNMAQHGPNVTMTRGKEGSGSSQQVTKATFGPCSSMDQTWLIHEQGKLATLTKSHFGSVTT